MVTIIDTDIRLKNHAKIISEFWSSSGRAPTTTEWQQLSIRSSMGPNPMHDGWGNPIMYMTDRREEGETFLLISFGRDGRPDLANPKDYFLLESAWSSDPNADQVNIGGKAVRTGGKGDDGETVHFPH